MTPKKQPDSFERALQRGLEHASRKPGEDCPGAEVLAACFEQTLDRGERARWERHFAACARCQAQLGVLARTEPAEERKLAEPAAAWWRWRWLAPAAAALGVIALWVAIRPSVPSFEQPVPVAVPQEKVAPAAPPASEADTLTKTQPQAGAPAAGTRTGQESALQSLNKKKEETKLAAANEAAPAETQKRAAAAPARTLADATTRDELAKAAPQQDQKKPAEAETARLPMATPAERAQLQAKQEETIRANATRADQAAPPVAADRVQGQSLPRSAEPGAAAMKIPEPQAAAGMRFRSMDSLAYFVVSPPSQMAGRLAREARPTGGFAETAVVWRAGAGGRIDKSVDGARTWMAQESPTDQDFLAGACASEKICWLVGREGTIVRTTDGEKWEKVAPPDAADLVSVTTVTERSAIVATADNRRFVTDDAGKTWRKL